MPRYNGNNSHNSNRTPRRRRSNPFPAIIMVLVLTAITTVGFFTVKNILTSSNEILPDTVSPVSDSSTRENSDYSDTSEEESIPEATPEPTPEATPTPTAPPIFDDGTDGYMSAGLYIWNKSAFELFYGWEGAAINYAHAVSSFKAPLGDRKVYNMVVPNHSEFGLPDRIRDKIGVTSQRKNTSDVYNNYTADIIAVDIYDIMNLHNNEYLYFNTDTHWAPLGAYYAYTKFCEVAEAEAFPLEKMTKTTVENFTGYLYFATNESVLKENPDHIDLYEAPFDYSIGLSYDGYEFSEVATINGTDPSMGYSMFAWGDNPCFKIINNDLTTGKKLVLVKDSYGNAMVPFLAMSFDEVHVIDFRHFTRNLPAYCDENGITDVLFFNNSMSANVASQVESMKSLFN